MGVGALKLIILVLLISGPNVEYSRCALMALRTISILGEKKKKFSVKFSIKSLQVASGQKFE